MDRAAGIGFLVEKASEISGTAGTAHVLPLTGDGSDRRFFRICVGSFSAIALISPRVKGRQVDENDSYHLIGSHLFARKVPVPRFLYADPREGRFLLEDAGDLHLQAFVRSHPARMVPVYEKAVRMLGTLHIRAAEGFEPSFCFDSALYDPPFVYERELEYFRRNFLNGFLGLEVGPDDLRSDFEALAEAAGVVSTSLVFHRDFQSRNIMVHGSALRLIDFQGMRFGPPAYDLASLLIDPYVQVPEILRGRLVRLYWRLTGKFQGVPLGKFLKKFEAVRLARNLQVLGAYGFLGLVKGKTRFLDYIPYAFQQLANHLAMSRRLRLPRLEKLVRAVRRGQTPRVCG